MIIKLNTVLSANTLKSPQGVDWSTQRLKSFDVRIKRSLYANKAYDWQIGYT